MAAKEAANGEEGASAAAEEEGPSVSAAPETEAAVGAAGAGEACSGHTVLTLLGRSNAGKSSLLNALAGRRLASVSRQPGHTRRVQSVQLSPTLLVRDTPALELAAPSAWAVDGASGVGAAPACELSGLSPSGGIRSPFDAVRAVAERTHLEQAYALTPNELREADEAEGALSAHGLCYALAAKKGFQQARNGAPDPHRAGLLVVRDCAEGALVFASRPPVGEGGL